jgi:putative transposase
VESYPEHPRNDLRRPPRNQLAERQLHKKSDRPATGHVEIDVPRDRYGTFEPAIEKKDQRPLAGVDEMVLPLYAYGLTTGEINAHFAQIYGAQVSKELISRITDKASEEMPTWSSRLLDAV